MIIEIKDTAHANWVRAVANQVQEALSGTRAIMLLIDPAGTNSTNPNLRRWWLQTNYDLEYSITELQEIAESLEGGDYEHEAIADPVAVARGMPMGNSGT